jgi:membrane dipeptidase
MYGIESPEEWPNIIRGLVSRGYSDDEIEKIAGGNALRVIQAVVG